VSLAPDLLQVAVPSLSGVTGRTYPFQMLKHEVQETALGPEGEVRAGWNDWHQGMLTAFEGEMDAGLPKFVSALGVDTFFPHQVLVQPVATTLAVASGAEALGVPVKQIDFVPSGGSIQTYLVQESRYLHRLNGSAQWARVLDVGVGNEVKDLIGAQNYLEAAVGSGSPIRESADGTTWASLSIYADRFAILNDQLWRALRPYFMYSTLLSASPYSWSSAYTVSDYGSNINSLTPVEQLLMIGKTDGPYSIGSDGASDAMAPELRPQANTDFASLRATVCFNSDYYFRTLNGIMQIKAGDGLKYRVGLDTLVASDLPAIPVRAMCSDDRFLYAVADNSAANGLLILRRTIEGAWHPFYYDTSAGRPHHLSFSGALGYPAIFFSYYDGSAYVTKFIRTSTFPNPLQDTNYRYDTGSDFYVRFARIGSTAVQLVIDHLVAQTLQCAAGRTVQFQVSIDGGAWANFGSAITTSPSSRVIPTAAIRGHFFDFRAVLTTNSATTSPVLKGVSIHGTRCPDRRRVHTFTVSLDRGQDSARQGTVARGTVRQLDDLAAVRAANAYATLKDETGRSWDGVLIDIRTAANLPRDQDKPVPQTAVLTFAEKVTS